MKTKVVLLLIVFFPLVGCDRLTKNQAASHLKGQDPLSFLNGIFSLTYHENGGAMLNLGSNLPDSLRFFIFTVLIALALFSGLVYLFAKPMNRLSFTVGLVILAGGFGNLYDRAFYNGHVVDFIHLQFGSLQTGVFNVADVAIMAGLFGFVFITSKWGQQLTKKTTRNHEQWS